MEKDTNNYFSYVCLMAKEYGGVRVEDFDE